MACSILKKLYNREIKGTIKQHRRQRQCQFFNKIPTRLCFRLPSLVSEEALEEGHVFLGFTKCGQFVVSYTCTMDADHQSVLPVCTYEYRLQWWWFVPNQPLKKVSEVKLFGEEELTVDLYISFCEWPSDHTKVLIFGHSLPSQTQDGCSSCYMTITSVPPLQQCEFCQVISSDEDKKQKPIKIPCMKHAFSVHTKFELTPPFPPFGPRTQLKIDGVVVINTGDSIVALTVNVDGFDEEESTSSIALTEVSVLIDNQNKDQYLENPKLESLKQYSRGPVSPTLCDCRRKYLDATLCPSPHSMDLMDESQKENMDGGLLKEYTRQRSPRGSFVEGPKLCKHAGSLVPSSQDWLDNIHVNTDTSQNADVLTQNNSVMQEVHESGSQVHTIDKDNSPLETIKCLRSPSKCDTSEMSRCNSALTNMSQKSTPPNEASDNARCPSPTQPANCRSPGPVKSPGPLYSPVCSPLQPSPMCNNCLFGNKNPAPSHRSFFSPSNSGTSTTSTSKSAESVYLQVNETRTVTYTVRKFSHTLQSGNQSPGIVEEDFDLAYRSILPLEVYGDKDKPFSPAHCREALQECVRVTQMTFDVEHYLEEVIGHFADWGHRYIAFTNYDLQILDVCAESTTVIGKVFALIHAKEESDASRKIKRSKNAIRRYQTSFCFAWNLATGGYETKFIGDLTEVDEVEIRRIESTWKEWKPGFKECAMLRRQMYIPQSTQRYVNVLSNESVIKGESLKFIIAPQHYVALLI